MRRPLSRFPSVLLLLAPLASSGCNIFEGDEWGDRREALERARARWQTLDADVYSFTFRQSCFCSTAAYGAVVVTVENGVVTAARRADSNEDIEPDRLSAFPTIDEVFDRIERALEERPDHFDVDYHPQLGYPAAAMFDYDFHMADDEIALSVTDLVLPGLTQ